MDTKIKFINNIALAKYIIASEEFQNGLIQLEGIRKSHYYTNGTCFVFKINDKLQTLCDLYYIQTL